MRLLVDANLSFRVASLLVAAGLDAVHVRDEGLRHAPDGEILAHARRMGAVVVSEDTEFGELLARSGADAPSFGLLRSSEPLTPDDQAALLVANVESVRADLEAGAVVVLERHRIRVRRLPFGPVVPHPRDGRATCCRRRGGSGRRR